MNTRERVLKEALNCVNGEREKQYGSPEDNFRRIADLWSTYLTSLFEDEKVVVDIDPIDVAKMMILFKIARSNGDKDKLDNYVDMIGYGACAAEIFENENPMEKEACETINELKEKMYADVFLGGAHLGKVQLADECKDCDYAEKCIGTGVCLKEKEKECIKDKPDEKCNRNDCGLFDACMTAYQHYIYNKTKEASEAIDKCMFEQVKKGTYSYYHYKLRNYVSIKSREEHIPLEKLKDVNSKFARELSDYLEQAITDCVINGKKLLDCYKEIDELFEKYKELSPYRVKGKHDSCLAYNNISVHISIESYRANVNVFDVVDHLTRNGHAPTDMACLLMDGKLGFDDVASYVQDAINELKKENKI